jgi:hypothetical protein
MRNALLIVLALSATFQTSRVPRTSIRAAMVQYISRRQQASKHARLLSSGSQIDIVKRPRLQAPPSEEDKADGYHMFDAESIDAMTWKLRSVIDNFTNFRGLALFMEQGNNAKVPASKTK